MEASVAEAGVALELRLEHGESAFEPGARVSGVAGWTARTAPTRLELELVWCAQSAAGRDVRIVETVTFDEPLADERRPFILALPAAPYSFRGALISLSWSLELTAHPGQERIRVALTIAPGRRVVELR
jgi:hypothetical protein